MLLAGCQALLLDKPQSPVLLVLEGGSGPVQEQVMSFPSCSEESLSPSHTTDELVPQLAARRHCNTRIKKPKSNITVRDELWLVV